MLYKEITKLSPKHPCLYYNSAWIGHAPFAMWITQTFKPNNIVELGSHGGYSYFAFCQAVQQYKLPTQCYAIDTWEGDDHASFYDETILDKVAKINNEYYSDFSHLIKKRFDQAVDLFEDQSIDLLHIDGRHGYEDVKYDFECYQSKLSDNAIVLFHDVNCFKPGFGVNKYFNELKQKYVTAEFKHSSGLGIVFYGKNLQNSKTYCEIIANLQNQESLLYNSLYLTGISIENHQKLARLRKKNSQYNNLKLKIFRHYNKIILKDFFYTLKLNIIEIKDKLFNRAVTN